MNIEEIWKLYFEYWKVHEPDMTEPCPGESSENILKLEQQLNLILPEDLKKSLSLTDHSSKKCDGLSHSWFGSRTGVSLFSSKEIFDWHNEVMPYFDFYDESLTNNYYGDIIPYTDGEKWPKEWLVIFDIHGICVFIDLRPNIGNQKGRILAASLGVEDENNIWYNHIVYVANSYTEFMQIMFEQIKNTQGNDEYTRYDDYFRNLLHLPNNYYDDNWDN